MICNAEERLALVHQVRKNFRPHFFMRCLELAYRIIPCCDSCEYNKAGRCIAPVIPFTDNLPNIHDEWYKISDNDNLCHQWSPSHNAVVKAISFAYKDEPQPQPQQPQPPKKKKTPAYTPELLAEQISLFHDRKITAKEAANNLGISPCTFYAKASNSPIPAEISPACRRSRARTRTPEAPPSIPPDIL